MDSKVSQVRAASAPNDDEISLLDLMSVVLRQRRLILVSTFVGALLAVLIAVFRSPLEYTATASFLPHGGEQGGFSGVAGLAQQFGFSMPRSGNPERSPEFYRDLLQSREILDRLVRSGVEVVTATGVTTVDLADHFEIEGAPAERKNALTREVLAGIISVSVTLQTGVVTLSVRTDDPGLSAAIGRRLLDLITAFDRETRRSQATAERNFAEERLGQLQGEMSIAEASLKAFLVENRQFSNSPQLTFEHDHLQRQVVMRQELVTAMAQAYEQARIDEVRNLPVITVIDQPEPPALPNPRGRLLKLILGLIIGLMAGFALAFLKDFGERAKNEKSEAYGEFRKVLKDAKGDLLGLRRSRRPGPSPADSDA